MFGTTMLDFLLSVFKRPAVTLSKKEAVRKVVRARSHGNVRLQMGQYYTKQDVDAKFDRIKGIDFAE